MQDADRPPEIQTLPQPARAHRPRVEAKPLRVVPLSESVDWIRRHRRGKRDIGQRSAIRPPEPERAVGLSIHLVALLVYRAMVPAAEQREIRQRGRAALRPMAHVMSLAQWESTTREAAAVVSVVQRAPQHRGNRPRSRPDLHDAPVLIVLFVVALTV